MSKCELSVCTRHLPLLCSKRIRPSVFEITLAMLETVVVKSVNVMVTMQ